MKAVHRKASDVLVLAVASEKRSEVVEGGRSRKYPIWLRNPRVNPAASAVAASFLLGTTRMEPRLHIIPPIAHRRADL